MGSLSLSHKTAINGSKMMIAHEVAIGWIAKHWKSGFTRTSNTLSASKHCVLKRVY